MNKLTYHGETINFFTLSHENKNIIKIGQSSEKTATNVHSQEIEIHS